MKKLNDTDEIFVLLKETPYYNQFDWFYEDMGFLRSVKDPTMVYRLSKINELSKWFWKTTPKEFRQKVFPGR